MGDALVAKIGMPFTISDGVGRMFVLHPVRKSGVENSFDLFKFKKIVIFNKKRGR